MSYLGISSRLNEGLNVQRAAALKRSMPLKYVKAEPKTRLASQAIVYETAVLGNDESRGYVNAILSVKDQISECLKKDLSNISDWDNFRTVILKLQKKLFEDINCAFLRIPDSLRNKSNDLIETLEIGLNTGLRIIIMTLNSIARKIIQEEGQISSARFIEKAKASYEFIEELTRLSVGTIAPFELFLRGVDLAPSPLELPREIVLKFASTQETHDPVKLYEISIELHNMFRRFFSEAVSNEDHFNLENLKFHSGGSITITDGALARFLHQSSLYLDRIINLKLASLKVLCGSPDDLQFCETTNICPARSVPVDVSSAGSQTNNTALTRAVYDYYIRQLEKLPNLDSLLKELV